MNELIERCKSFMDAIPLGFTHEFENEYCDGQPYYFYVKENPKAFAENVIKFSLRHKDTPYFQSAAVRHLGPESVRSELLTKQNEPMIQNTKEQPVKPEQHEKKEKVNPQIQSKNKTHGQLFSPVQPHTDEENRKNIRYKLFTRPQSHDRYTRLTTEERRFILRNAGLSTKERKVFDMKCDRKYYKYKDIAILYGFSESWVKQISIRIDKHIRHMLDN